MKKNPLGIESYSYLRENNYFHVDKILLIKDIMDRSQVLYISRLRGFGKTLALSMLRTFFEYSEKSNEHLFSDRAIWQHKEYRALQGKFPVIAVTFKNVREGNWEVTYDKIAWTIAEEYQRHMYLLSSDLLAR